MKHLLAVVAVMFATSSPAQPIDPIKVECIKALTDLASQLQRTEKDMAELYKRLASLPNAFDLRTSISKAKTSIQRENRAAYDLMANYCRDIL